MQRILCGMATALAAVALSACGNGAENDESGVGVVDNPYAQGIATYDDGGTDGGDGALLEGMIVRQNGCLVIEAPSGDRMIPAVPEQQISGIEDQLTLYGVDVAEGDTVAFGGGGSGEGSHLAIPAECAALNYDYFTSWTMEKR